ncbi:MAG: hypothetical protein R2681_02010 [Pyrinomonadaceae bacterium]
MENLLVKIAKMLALGLFISLNFACEGSKLSSANKNLTNNSSPTVNPTKAVKTTVQNESVTALCNRLHEIKKLPYRDPNDTDPIYESLVANEKESVLCLVNKITDETSMADPREAPPWQNYKVGDTAVFILNRIVGKGNNLLPEMLPPKFQQEWKTNGVYAYFNYVSESKNRKQLQKWWKKRINKDQ